MSVIVLPRCSRCPGAGCASCPVQTPAPEDGELHGRPAVVPDCQQGRCPACGGELVPVQTTRGPAFACGCRLTALPPASRRPLS